MKIPKNCFNCKLSNKSLCAVTGEYLPFLNGRDRYCPMKSVEELIEKISDKKIYKGRTAYSDMHDADTDKIHDIALDEAIEIIKEYCGVSECTKVL